MGVINMNIIATIALIFIALALCNKYSPSDSIVLRKIIKIILIVVCVFIIFIFFISLFLTFFMEYIII